MSHLSELKKKNDEYLAKLKAQGVPMLTYKAACCGATLENRAATAGERWDTLATCPECGGLYMKITTADKIEALIPEVA